MYLANIITLGRLLSVPLAVWLILDGAMLAAFIVFVLAGASDAVASTRGRPLGDVPRVRALRHGTPATKIGR